jgi:hypothetical protein
VKADIVVAGGQIGRRTVNGCVRINPYIRQLFAFLDAVRSRKEAVRHTHCNRKIRVADNRTCATTDGNAVGILKQSCDQCSKLDEGQAGGGGSMGGLSHTA